MVTVELEYRNKMLLYVVYLTSSTLLPMVGDVCITSLITLRGRGGRGRKGEEEGERGRREGGEGQEKERGGVERIIITITLIRDEPAKFHQLTSLQPIIITPHAQI